MLSADPEFIVFTGPMFGSKTTRLLAAIERLHYRSKAILAFKPALDTRSKKSKIATHSGAEINATPVRTGADILETCLNAEIDVVAVDEAFMIPGVASALLTLFSEGKSVLVSSIQLTSSAAPLFEIKEMLPWATRIEVCPAVCPITGRDAYYTHKKTSSLQTIEIGGSDLYEPRCWEHSLVGQGNL